ncbi:mas-related G-protein coupled receptor member X1-like [Gastrophryne carolinensis]
MSNLTSNISVQVLCKDPPTVTVQITLCLVTVLVCLIGLIGNAKIVLHFCFRIKLNQSTTYILNLAVADFLFLFGCCVVSLYLLCILNRVRTSEESDAGIAKFGEFLNNFAFNASLFFLATLSFERSLSVCFPIWYKCRRPWRLTAVLCSVMWVLSLLIAVLERFLSSEQRLTVYIVTSIVFLLLTLLMVGSSVLLLTQIQKASRQCRPLKLYVVIAVAVLNFLLSLVPARIVKIVFAFFIVPTSTSAIVSYMVISLCSALSSTINPYINIVVGRWNKSASTARTLETAFKEDSDGTSGQNITVCSHLSDSNMKLEASELSGNDELWSPTPSSGDAGSQCFADLHPDTGEVISTAAEP